MKRSYTDAQRAEALEAYREHGPAKAGRRTGIPAGTIRQWAKRGGLTSARTASAQASVAAAHLSWAQRRADVCMRAGEVAADLLERAAASGKHREVRDFMASFAVAIDKAQLLDGEPTARVASADERRKQVQHLRDELAARRAEAQ